MIYIPAKPASGLLFPRIWCKQRHILKKAKCGVTDTLQKTTYFVGVYDIKFMERVSGASWAQNVYHSLVQSIYSSHLTTITFTSMQQTLQPTKYGAYTKTF